MGWGTVHFLKGHIDRNRVDTWKDYHWMGIDVGVLLLIPTGAYLFRKLLFQNQASRRYVWLIFLLVLGLLAQSGLAYLTDVSLQQNTFQQILLAMIFAAALSVTVDR